MALYRSYAMGVPLSLPDPQAQYADYTMWELDWVRGPEIANRIANWRKRLAGSAATQLPLDHPRPPRQSLAGGTIPLTIEHSTVEALRRAARTVGGTLFHALAAAYALWLHLTQTRPRSSSAARMTCATATTCSRSPATAPPRWSYDVTCRAKSPSPH